MSINDLEALATAYEDVLGPMNHVIGGRLKGFMDKGMKVDVIIDAIYTTGFAPRPSFYYLWAILRRYWDSGIRTMEDVDLDRKQREERRRAAYRERIGAFYRLPDDDMAF